MTIKHGQKFCTKCRTLKPLSSFDIDKHKRFGVAVWCKNCKAEYVQSGRQEVLDSMGGKCVYCGCNMYRALEINHKYGGGRQDPAGKGANLIRAILRGSRTTNDLELVCAICNIHHKLVELDGVFDGWTITWEDPQ